MGMGSFIRRFKPFRKRVRRFVALSTGTVGDRRGGVLDVLTIAAAQDEFETLLRTYNNLVAQGFKHGSEEANHAVRILENAEDCAHAIAEAYHKKSAIWVQRAERRIEATEAMRKSWRTKG